LIATLFHDTLFEIFKIAVQLIKRKTESKQAFDLHRPANRA